MIRVKFYMVKEPRGRYVTLRASSAERPGLYSNIVTFYQDGSIQRNIGVQDNLGLTLDNNGRIVIQ